MKITMVLVLYKKKPEESKTFTTLLKSFFYDPDRTEQVELIIYDNSPKKQEIGPLDYEGMPITYVHDPRNLGIVTAYNHAWETGRDHGSDWLLLLDHDTDLTAEYIREVTNLPSLSQEVAAVVPQVTNENILISPVFSHTLRPLQVERPKGGLQTKPVMAINSGALIRMSFLNELGGFNEEFPLDYLDHWLFYEIYAKRKKVFVLDTVLEHELSVMDYSRVSLGRYESILKSELNFYKNYKTELLPAFKKQLAKRFLKQALTVRNKRIAMHTLRLLVSM